MHRISSKTTFRNSLKPEAKTVYSRKSCGKCGKTIRMRDGFNALVCTAILGVVDPRSDDVCEHYVERVESTELSLAEQAG